MVMTVSKCDDCKGTRSTPDIFGDLGPCPSCVIESDEGTTWAVIESDVQSSERLLYRRRPAATWATVANNRPCWA